jgi:hypothetical protein
VFGGAVEGERAMAEVVQEAGEPAVLPIGGRGQWCGVVFVGVLPGEPKRGEFFDHLRVFGPARRDLSGQRVSASDPAHPGRELTPELLGSHGAEVAPTPGGRGGAAGPGCGCLEVLESREQVAAMSVVSEASASRSWRRRLMSWAWLINCLATGSPSGAGTGTSVTWAPVGAGAGGRRTGGAVAPGPAGGSGRARPLPPGSCWSRWSGARWSVCSLLERLRRPSAPVAATTLANAAREANQQARRESFEQRRPYVFAEVVPGLAGATTWDLRVTNSRHSAARKLVLGYDKLPENRDDVAAASKDMFVTPRTLPRMRRTRRPGSELRLS